MSKQRKSRKVRAKRPELNEEEKFALVSLRSFGGSLAISETMLARPGLAETKVALDRLSIDTKHRRSYVTRSENLVVRMAAVGRVYVTVWTYTLLEDE